MSTTEKKEGAEQTCRCGTELVCVKIIKEWQGKKEEKLQWQNKTNKKPHFKFAGPGKFDCIIPEQKDETPQTTPSSDKFLKQKQEELKNQKKITDSNMEKTKKTEFTAQDLQTMDKEIDKLIVIEAIVTKKLTTGDLPPNPAKVGMYMKFLYDKLDMQK